MPSGSQASHRPWPSLAPWEAPPPARHSVPPGPPSWQVTQARVGGAGTGWGLPTQGMRGHIHVDYYLAEGKQLDILDSGCTHMQYISTGFCNQNPHFLKTKSISPIPIRKNTIYRDKNKNAALTR